LAFESWKIAKRFLKGPQVEVTGPQGRAQGEEAENRLQALLGFVKDSSQRGDPTTYGALGLLWVPQAQALEVTAPGSIVRSSIQATLEAEVGTIVGGAAYERVRKRIDEQYDIYWTPTGKAQSKGRWQAARDRDQQARQTAADATKRLDALETSFGELETARGRLKVIERELADETEQEQRAGLVQSLEIAKAAAQILETRKAEHENFSANLDRLNDLQSQHEAAKEALTAAGESLTAITVDRDQLADQLEAGRTKSRMQRQRWTRRAMIAPQPAGRLLWRGGTSRRASASCGDRRCTPLTPNSSISKSNWPMPAIRLHGSFRLRRSLAWRPMTVLS
jgi:DNA repair exonuclease SbcCD ATPase subunit